MKEDDEEEVLPTYIYIYVMYVCTLYKYQYYRNALTTTYYLIHIHGDIQSVPNTLVTFKSLH